MVAASAMQPACCSTRQSTAQMSCPHTPAAALRSKASSKSSFLPALQRSRTARTAVVTTAFAGAISEVPLAAMGLGVSGSGVNWSTVSSAVGVVLAALAAFALQQQTSEETDPSSPDEACPTCEGRGVTTCHCTRWSDGDQSGCSSCGGSLQQPCPSCGGGGRARPIVQKLYAKSTDRLY